MTMTTTTMAMTMMPSFSRLISFDHTRKAINIKGFKPLTMKTIFIFFRGKFQVANKAYPIQTDAGLQFVYCHFGDLGDCGPGPWTMVMKLNGSTVVYCI